MAVPDAQGNSKPPAEPEIVGGAKTLDLVAEFLERFVVFANKSQVYAVALWVLHSHGMVLDQFPEAKRAMVLRLREVNAGSVEEAADG
jgi:hypothetical protein